MRSPNETCVLGERTSPKGLKIKCGIVWKYVFCIWIWYERLLSVTWAGGENETSYTQHSRRRKSEMQNQVKRSWIYAPTFYAYDCNFANQLLFLLKRHFTQEHEFERPALGRFTNMLQKINMPSETNCHERNADRGANQCAHRMNHATICDR